MKPTSEGSSNVKALGIEGDMEESYPAESPALLAASLHSHADH